MTSRGYTALAAYIQKLSEHLSNCDRHGAEHANRAVCGHIPSDAFDVDINGMADALVASQLTTALLIYDSSQPISLPEHAERVCLGTCVSLSKNGEPSMPYVIVGANEPQYAWPEKRLISTASPLGKALLGKMINDEVTVVTKKSENTWEIAGIGTILPEEDEKPELMLEIPMDG